MTPYLHLDLDAIPIDPLVARRVPYALSRYYLALPLSQENGRVSVAMTYPDNTKARQILAHLLQAEVVPVFVPVEALRAALERVHRCEQPYARPILAWYGRPEWETAVNVAAARLGDRPCTQVVTLTAQEAGLAQALALTAGGEYELAVCPLPPAPALPAVLSQTAVPLFFVRGPWQPIRRILVVIRGFASDERALDWLAPFAGRRQATVTLMPLLSGAGLDLHQYHHPDSLAGQHLARCLYRLRTEGVAANLKFRQGRLVQQVVNEVAEDGYELLVIAAEAEGDFVSQVITAVDQHHAHDGRPIFVLKPPELPRADVQMPGT